MASDSSATLCPHCGQELTLPPLDREDWKALEGFLVGRRDDIKNDVEDFGRLRPLLGIIEGIEGKVEGEKAKT